MQKVTNNKEPNGCFLSNINPIQINLPCMHGMHSHSNMKVLTYLVLRQIHISHTI